MKGVQRSVTPEAFSAGTTAKVSSGYFVFQSCAEAAEMVKASAMPASKIRRLIMTSPVGVGDKIGRLQTGNRPRFAYAILKPRRLCRAPGWTAQRVHYRAPRPSPHRLRDRRVRGRYDRSGRRAHLQTRPGRKPCRSAG